MKNKELEGFGLSAFLALSGGFQDAYTYITRNHVFSNAQTGNVILMTQNLMEGQLAKALSYALPISAFILGIFIAEQLQGKKSEETLFHWQAKILFIEISTLFFVGFLAEQWNSIATMLVSFSCALQVQAFQRLNGNPYASTMCIGNIKSGTAAFSVFIREKKKEKLIVSLHYLGIVTIFAIGAGLGALLSRHFGYPVIWISCLLLFVPFVFISIKKGD